MVLMATKEDDPFRSMVGMIQKEGSVHNPTPFFIGIVKQAKPLRVLVGDIEIGREEMKVCSSLLGGFSQRLSMGQTNASGNTQNMAQHQNQSEDFASHSHDIVSVGIPNGTFTLLDDLKVGDEVLILMSQDQQQFVCVCKVE